MPYITLDGPKMTKEQKAQLVKEFTESAVKILKLPQQAFTVIIRETDPDNVGVGGKLLSEIRK